MTSSPSSVFKLLDRKYPAKGVISNCWSVYCANMEEANTTIEIDERRNMRAF